MEGRIVENTSIDYLLDCALTFPVSDGRMLANDFESHFCIYVTDSVKLPTLSMKARVG
jgi:hypothetical protein